MTHDHRNEDLRRKSFATQSLQAANFDGADLRGADFTRADLSNASFRNARVGVPPGVGAVILVAALALSVTFGVVAGLAIDAVRDRLYSPGWERPSGAVGILIILVVFVIVMFWKGIDTAIKTYVWTFAVVLAVSLVVRLIWGDIDIGVAARGIGLALVLALAVVSGIIGRVVGGALGAWGIAVVAILSGLAAGRAQGGLAALVISVSMVLISKRALRGDDRDRFRTETGASNRGSVGNTVRPRRPDRRRLQWHRRHPLRRCRCNPRRRPLGTGTSPTRSHRHATTGLGSMNAGSLGPVSS